MRFDRYPFSFEVPRAVIILTVVALAIAVLTVFCGCGVETSAPSAQDRAAHAAAVDAWEALVGPVSPEQRERVLDLHVLEMPLEDVQVECNTGGFVLGCIYPEDGYYVRAEGLTQNDVWWVSVHEAIHMLSWFRGDSDPDHSDPAVWSRHQSGTVANLGWEARPW